MNDSTGTNGHIVANRSGDVSLNLGYVNNSSVTNTCSGSDSDIINITSYSGTVPNAVSWKKGETEGKWK
jgi:hypothetical protein